MPYNSQNVFHVSQMSHDSQLYFVIHKKNDAVRFIHKLKEKESNINFLAKLSYIFTIVYILQLLYKYLFLTILSYCGAKQILSIKPSLYTWRN